MEHSITWLGIICLMCVAISLTIIGRYLWKKPPLNASTKLTLLLGIGVLPGAAAASSTVTGMEATTERHFCGSCHTMDAYVADASEFESQSLAARHGRNPFFGDHNCYVCHADYGMMGYPMTKIGGMRHVYEYYLNGWNAYSPQESLDKLHLRKPYDNTNCRQCHSGTLADWSAVPEHLSLAKELDSNQVSCASSGCHGYAHPFSKKDGGQAAGLPPSAIGGSADDRPVSSALPQELRERVESAKQSKRDAKTAASVDKAAELERAREAARKAARERSDGKAPAPTPSVGGKQ